MVQIITKEENKFISIPKLAKRWGVSRSFIWEQCKSGKIPSMRINTKWCINFEWVEEQEKTAKK